MKKKFTAKLYILMKVCAVQGMLAMIFVGLSWAHPNLAQILDNPINLELSNVSLEQALREIESVTEIKFAYNSDMIDYQDIINMNAVNTPLREVLNELLNQRGISYKVHEREGVITLKKEQKKTPQISLAQTKISRAPLNVEGVVRDNRGTPMAGVNILVKGTLTGTSTDATGSFLIQAENNDVLVFSFIGFVTQEITIGLETHLEIVLIEDTKSLEEVVVNAGYYHVNNREHTGNIALVSGNDISRQPVANPLQALHGRMPGVYVQQTSGVPGSNIKIQIRGQNSLRLEGNDPLYLVDGIPYSPTPLGSLFSNAITNGGSPLSYINPSDIESIEVLKDADATAIYGSRGANGVVLITTKKGQIGKTNLEVNFYTGAGKVSHQMDLLNSKQYLEMRNEAFANDQSSPASFNAPDLLTWDTTRYTDWQKMLLGGTAQMTNAQINLTGGNSQTQFRLGSGMLKESTVFPGNFNDQKISTHLNLTHHSNNNKLEMSVTTSFMFDKNRLLYQDLTNVALNLPPVAPALYTEEGALNWQPGFQNPLSTLLQTFEANTHTLFANTSISYRILPHLKLKSNMGFNMLTMKEHVKYPIASFNPAYGILQGSATFSNRDFNTWIVEPQAEYETAFGKSKIAALIGATLQQTLREGATTYGFGFSSDALLDNIQAATSTSSFFQENAKYRYAALFGRINYTWNKKYIINLTARRDGSSRFGENKRFGTFGAIGAAWILSEERFLQDKKGLSFAKIRGSWGTTGSDQIGDYQYLDTYSASNNPYQGVPGLVPTRLANQNYSWEKNTKMEGGIDAGFAEDRILLGISYYNNRSGNQLIGYPLSAVTGFSSVQSNLPAIVRNSGWEVELSTQPLTNRQLNWNASFNITLPQNKLLEFDGLENSSYADTYEVGKSLFIQKRFHFVGVDQSTGIYQFQDVDNNGSGMDAPQDLQALVTLAQKWYGGLNNSFTYKQWELSFFLQIVNQTGKSYFGGFKAPGNVGNQPVQVLQRWSAPGDRTDIQKFTAGFGAAASAYATIANRGDNNIVDASFIRLKNVALSWNLPPGWLSKANVSNAKLFLQGQNLLTKTNYIGLDPENQSLNNIPPLRMVTIGFQATF